MLSGQKGKVVAFCGSAVRKARTLEMRSASAFESHLGPSASAIICCKVGAPPPPRAAAAPPAGAPYPGGSWRSYEAPESQPGRTYFRGL